VESGGCSQQHPHDHSQSVLRRPFRLFIARAKDGQDLAETGALSNNGQLSVGCLETLPTAALVPRIQLVEILG
jgi:hypothetical protein